MLAARRILLASLLRKRLQTRERQNDLAENGADHENAPPENLTPKDKTRS